MKQLLIAALKHIVKSKKDNIWYHLTDNHKFKLDKNYAPEDASLSIVDRSGRPVIYLSQDVEQWVSGYGYWRPFVVEFEVDPSVVDDKGVHGRWGAEMFIPADSYNKLTLKRVIPLDAYAREKFRDHGWIETYIGEEFDTGKEIEERGMFSDRELYPFKGYRYEGLDVRQMPASDIRRLKQHLKKS